MQNKLLTLITLLLISPFCWSLTSDKQQDIEIEADSAEMDDAKGISIYRGDVVVVQGSIRMTGDIMTVYFDENDDMKLVVMEGQPATYRQLPDDSEVYDEAESLRMEYYSLKDYVILIDKALVTQEDMRLSGDRIEYNTITNQAKAESRTSTTIKDKAEKPKEGGRVKLIIKKKKEEQ